MHGGYKAITPVKLLNALCAYRDRNISFKALRVYLSCFELEAIREAAKRASILKGRAKKDELVRYQKTELIALTGGLTLRSINSSLNELKKAELLVFKSQKITFRDLPTDKTTEILSTALGSRRGTRAVPVPRKLIKYLSKETKPALVLTVISYLLRGLSVNRKSGEMNKKGTIKISYICNITGISERAAKESRASLIALGLISKDINSYQRKLNRDGAYFVLNFSFLENHTKSSQGEVYITKEDISTSETRSAPLQSKKSTENAPPNKRLKTSKEYKNQKTSKSSEINSGFLIKNKFNKNPDIRNIQIEDLKSFGRVEKLYFQAVNRGLIEATESGAINFISAAARATTVGAAAAAEGGGGGDAVRIFMGIVRQKLWKNITQADEDRALSALKKYREDDPMRFKIAA